MNASPAAGERTILIYGLTAMEESKLAFTAMQAGIRCHFVTNGEVTLTISQLLAGKTKTAPVLHLPGKFALLDGFNGQEEIAISLINQVSDHVVKAVHTPHNSGWLFSELCFAIGQENVQMSSGKK